MNQNELNSFLDSFEIVIDRFLIISFVFGVMTFFSFFIIAIFKS